MSDWLDEVIRAAMARGDFDNLPGQGKPLPSEEWEAHVPPEQRMAYKLLRDNDLAPDWIVESRALDADRARWVAERERIALLPDAGQRARALAISDAAASALNRQLLTWNLKVPPGVPHKRLIDLRRFGGG